MDEPIDAVALGLKRGPRGAVCVALLVIAIPVAVVATRSGGEWVSVQQPAPVLDELTPLAPVPAAPRRSRTKRIVQPKAAAPVPVVIAEKAVPPPAVVVAELPREPRTEVPQAVPEPAVVVEKTDLVPPLAPPPEPEAATEPERDGNGEAIARSIAASKRAAVRACFESELKQFPKLHGTVVVELDLAPPNRVNGVRVNDDLERAAFTACVVATMRDVKFGALDEEISVSVPYVLTPAAK